MSPERFYRFNRPVVSLSFCDTEYTQLVAVGFGDGSVQIVDVSYENSQSHVAITKRTTSPPAEPVWRIKWLQGILFNTCHRFKIFSIVHHMLLLFFLFFLSVFFICVTPTLRYFFFSIMLCIISFAP